MTNYVVGLLFNKELSEVCLIRKNRPGWQAGKLNGVGGHVEDGESPAAAMTREFYEEAGIAIADWVPFARLDGGIGDGDWSVYMFYAISDESPHTKTDEPVGMYPVNFLGSLTVMPNLRYFVPMGLNHISGEDSCRYFVIQEL